MQTQLHCRKQLTATTLTSGCAGTINNKTQSILPGHQAPMEAGKYQETTPKIWAYAKNKTTLSL